MFSVIDPESPPATRLSERPQCPEPQVDFSSEAINLAELAAALEEYPEISGIHDACNALPLPCAGDLFRLIRSIQQTGFIEPVLVDDSGALIDGRSRILATYRLGKKAPVQTTAEPAWNIALANAARRHLTKSQLAILALELLPQFKADAAARQRAALRRGKDSTEKTEPTGLTGSAASLAAKQFGVSTSLVEQALQLPQEYRNRVRVGELTISKAKKLLDRSKRSAAPRDARHDHDGGQTGGKVIRRRYCSAFVGVLNHRETLNEAILFKGHMDDWLVCTSFSTKYHYAPNRMAATILAEELLVEHADGKSADDQAPEECSDFWSEGDL